MAGGQQNEGVRAQPEGRQPQAEGAQGTYSEKLKEREERKGQLSLCSSGSRCSSRGRSRSL